MGLKDSNEMTVKVLDTVENLVNKLEEKGFKAIDKFTLNDYYMIPKDLQIENIPTREIISKAVIIRDIKREENAIPMLTFKKKEFNEKGDILSQKAINCQVYNAEDARSFMKAINYMDLIYIIEDGIVYRKEELELEIKVVKNGDLLIEIETKPNTEYDTIEKLKTVILELGIPIEANEYFIKKAEVEVGKLLNR